MRTSKLLGACAVALALGLIGAATASVAETL